MKLIALAVVWGVCSCASTTVKTDASKVATAVEPFIVAGCNLAEAVDKSAPLAFVCGATEQADELVAALAGHNIAAAKTPVAPADNPATIHYLVTCGGTLP